MRVQKADTESRAITLTKPNLLKYLGTKTFCLFGGRAANGKTLLLFVFETLRRLFLLWALVSTLDDEGAGLKDPTDPSLEI